MNMENNIVDKMKSLQILYNMDKCGIDVNNMLQSRDLEKEHWEEWAKKVLDENRELLDNITEEQFINFILYGK